MRLWWSVRRKDAPASPAIISFLLQLCSFTEVPAQDSPKRNGSKECVPISLYLHVTQVGVALPYNIHYQSQSIFYFSSNLNLNNAVLCI